MTIRTSGLPTIQAVDAGADVKGSQPVPMTEDAFRTLYDTNASRLRAYLRRAAGDVALADDLVQETFLKLLASHLPALDERASRAYLFRIATNLLRDHWRRATRERRRSLLEILFGEPVAPAVESLELLSTDTARGFAALTPREQALLWMAYVEGFDHREVAEALDLSAASVRVLLFRARRKLATLLTTQGSGRSI